MTFRPLVEHAIATDSIPDSPLQETTSGAAAGTAESDVDISTSSPPSPSPPLPGGFRVIPATEPQDGDDDDDVDSEVLEESPIQTRMDPDLFLDTPDRSSQVLSRVKQLYDATEVSPTSSPLPESSSSSGFLHGIEVVALDSIGDSSLTSSSNSIPPLEDVRFARVQSSAISSGKSVNLLKRKSPSSRQDSPPSPPVPGSRRIAAAAPDSTSSEVRERERSDPGDGGGGDSLDEGCSQQLRKRRRTHPVTPGRASASEIIELEPSLPKPGSTLDQLNALLNSHTPEKPKPLPRRTLADVSHRLQVSSTRIQPSPSLESIPHTREQSGHGSSSSGSMVSRSLFSTLTSAAATAADEGRPDLEVVRNKELREQMTAVSCVQCENWYKAMEGRIDPEQAAGIRNLCQHAGRHRFWKPPPSTPDGFWDISSPASQQTAGSQQPSASISSSSFEKHPISPATGTEAESENLSSISLGVSESIAEDGSQTSIVY